MGWPCTCLFLCLAWICAGFRLMSVGYHVSDRICYLIGYIGWAMNAAELLEQARVSSGMTQDELARRAGTSRPTLSAYEHGRKSPTVATFARILPRRDGNWQHSRTCHSPSSHPRAEGRHGSRTGCRGWTWRAPSQWWNFHCTSTGRRQGAYSISGRVPTAPACTRSSCRREGPPTSSLTSMARCSSTCGMTWSSRGRSGLPGHR